MDEIKELIEKAVKMLQEDDNLMENFKKDPIKAVEGILGVDLPDDQIKSVIDGVKAKVSFDGIADKIGGLFGGLKK